MTIPAPHIYEINTLTWLHGLSVTHSKKITLATVPDEELDFFASLHLDMIWLMGVWQRSADGIVIAREHPDLQGDYQRVLPDYTDADITGSPYAVGDYRVEPLLGTAEDLAQLRGRLQARGIGLILDFVPNHIATDHPWTSKHPDYLIQGTPDELDARRDDFFSVGGHVIAYGRDPYFPAWTDTAQVNAFSADFRQAVIDLLLDIASQCDGIRCDMAMLLTNRVFKQTWGERGGTMPETEFWMEIIPAVKKKYPNFLFIAEVYWHMEGELHRQGFDYCYDKSLYDNFEHGDAKAIRELLSQDISYQSKLVRFIENHDEPRAMTSMEFNRAWMAALLMATLPGAKLWHEGQFVGHRVKLPVQLGRRPLETDDVDLLTFYRLLLQETTTPVYREGIWRLCSIGEAWDDNPTFDSLIAYSWQHDNTIRLVVVNFSETRTQGKLYPALPTLSAKEWALRDILGNKRFVRQGTEILADGLLVDLDGWSGHLFKFEQLASSGEIA